MFTVTIKTEDGKILIAAGCNYPDECYVLVAKKLQINVHKKEFTKQISLLDIGASVFCKNEKVGIVRVTRIPTISEFSYLSIPIENI